jgi:hypothetical protein
LINTNNQTNKQTNKQTNENKKKQVVLSIYKRKDGVGGAIPQRLLGAK